MFGLEGFKPQYRKNSNNLTVCYEVQNSLLRKGQKSQQNHSPFPLFETEKNNFLSLLREESPKTEHTVQLFEFLRHDVTED